MTTYTEDNNPINIYTNESSTWSPGTNTIMNCTGSPGVVESIQICMSVKDYTMELNVQIDNYPTIACSALAFFGFYLDPNTSTQPVLITPSSLNTSILGGINNKNYIGSNGQGYGCTRRMFIPFSSNITISLTNLQTMVVTSQVVYRKWPSTFPLYYSIGERRKYWKLLQIGNEIAPWTLSQYQLFESSQITGRGQIEFITHVLWGVNPAIQGDETCSPITCLEGSCTLTIDGVAQVVTTTDTFWGGQHYWSYGKTLSNGPDCGMFAWCTTGSSSNPDKFNMHTYKFCYDKTIFFNESFQFSWTYGDSNYSKFGQGVTNCNNIFIISYWLESE